MSFEELLLASEENRNQAWEEEFLNIFPSKMVNLIYEDTKPGPDNWPYLWVSTEKGERKQEPAKNIIQWLAGRGIGLVVNPQKKLPDYVFSYGMLWHFQEHKAFGARTLPDFTNNQKLELIREQFYFGYPSDEYIPQYVRTILRDFFLQQGIFKAKWLLLTKDQKSYDLCFSLESLKSPPESEHAGVLEAISWFLPNHFQLAIFSEKDMPKFEAI